MDREDRWTPPSPWCPEPRWWHAGTADATEREVSELVAAFARALQPGITVETGANTGQTAEAIGRALAANGHGRLFTLETDPALASAAAERCAGLPVEVICADSTAWDPPGLIGLAWIDSSLGTRAVEISRWAAWFAPGAVIGIHDTAPHHPVMRSVLPVLEAQGMAFLNLRTPRGVVFAQVP